MSNIGTRIRDYIETNGLNATSFAEMVSLSKSTISDLINIQTVPSQKTINTIIKNSDISSKWLRHGEGEMIKNTNNKTLASLNEDEMEEIKETPIKDHQPTNNAGIRDAMTANILATKYEMMAENYKDKYTDLKVDFDSLKQAYKSKKEEIEKLKTDLQTAKASHEQEMGSLDKGIDGLLNNPERVLQLATAAKELGISFSKNAAPQGGQAQLSTEPHINEFLQGLSEVISELDQVTLAKLLSINIALANDPTSIDKILNSGTK